MFKTRCGNDTFYITTPKNDLTFLDTTSVNLQSYNDTDNVPDKPMKADEMEGLRNGFADPNPTSGMYDFEIKTFGWYNIDAYVEGYEGTSNVKLWAQINGSADIDIDVYLFCPEKKMLSVGQYQQGDKYDKYYFDKINGGVPLFLHDRAILFAFGSKGDKMYYGISEFRIQKNQTIPVNIKETTDEEIRTALRSKNIDGIDLGIEKKEKVVVERSCDEQPVTSKADSLKGK
jgi:hypothetical protein